MAFEHFDVKLKGTISREQFKKGKIQKKSILPSNYTSWSIDEIIANINILEKQMNEHAKNLEYEQAANVRDTVKILEEAFKSQ